MMMMAKLVHQNVSKAVATTVSMIVGAAMVTLPPSISLADTTAKPNHPAIATIKSLTSGDRACYAAVMDDKGLRSTQFASFEICDQQQDLVGKRVQLTYKVGNILAASCQGNVDCGKTDQVMLISQVRLINALTTQSSATIQPKTLTFTRGKKGQDSYKQATVQIPTITTGPNSAVLKQVQDAIGPKQVLGESVQELDTEFQKSGALSRLSYKVNYNKNAIVHLTYTKETVTSYPSTFRHYVAVDLQTGKVITAADLLTPSGLENLAATIDQLMQQRIQKTIAEKGTQDGDLKTRLTGKQFKIQNLNTFLISEKGITFIYDFDFPHAIQALAPDGEFFLTYDQLQPSFKPVARLGR